MTDAISDIKAAIRNDVLAARDALVAPDRQAAAETLAARDLPVPVTPGMIVAGFSPIRSEINPFPLMRKFADAGAHLALPAILGRGKPLAMRAWSFGAPLVSGQWGIREPHDTAPEVLPDVLLVPLAAFDRRGQRIGYGAGYYDMTIAALRAAKSVIAIGLAYSLQEVAEVPATIHDEPLDLVLTERETITARGMA